MKDGNNRVTNIYRKRKRNSRPKAIGEFVWVLQGKTLRPARLVVPRKDGGTVSAAGPISADKEDVEVQWTSTDGFEYVPLTTIQFQQEEPDHPEVGRPQRRRSSLRSNHQSQSQQHPSSQPIVKMEEEEYEDFKPPQKSPNHDEGKTIECSTTGRRKRALCYSSFTNPLPSDDTKYTSEEIPIPTRDNPATISPGSWTATYDSISPDDDEESVVGAFARLAAASEGSGAMTTKSKHITRGHNNDELVRPESEDVSFIATMTKEQRIRHEVAVQHALNGNCTSHNGIKAELNRKAAERREASGLTFRKAKSGRWEVSAKQKATKKKKVPLKRLTDEFSQRRIQNRKHQKATCARTDSDTARNRTLEGGYQNINLLPRLQKNTISTQDSWRQASTFPGSFHPAISASNMSSFPLMQSQMIKMTPMIPSMTRNLPYCLYGRSTPTDSFSLPQTGHLVGRHNSCYFNNGWAQTTFWQRQFNAEVNHAAIMNASVIGEASKKLEARHMMMQQLSKQSAPSNQFPRTSTQPKRSSAALLPVKKLKHDLPSFIAGNEVPSSRTTGGATNSSCSQRTSLSSANPLEKSGVESGGTRNATLSQKKNKIDSWSRIDMKEKATASRNAQITPNPETRFQIVAQPGKSGIRLTNDLVVHRIESHCQFAHKVSLGDKLVSIDNLNIDGWSVDQFLKLIRGIDENMPRTFVFSRDVRSSKPKAANNITRQKGIGVMKTLCGSHAAATMDQSAASQKPDMAVPSGVMQTAVDVAPLGYRCKRPAAKSLIRRKRPPLITQLAAASSISGFMKPKSKTRS